ncbi:MAG: DNA mismatch repair endonuclease MutL [Planctomycetes bacterium]|nr:DNA mismatch repair endonuclease MutL [Planctomycetota bacterium]
MSIRLLDPRIVDQIAAGEVVERPASVVKELVENALDAGATRIAIELMEGGRGLVRVVDDGSGIPASELALAFASHATSKLADVGDLEHIATLGFRGEALASIGSISRARIRSRARGSEAGAEIEDHGGRVGDVRAAAAPPGTSVEVRDLFFNTPARRKFLKRDSTELGHCVEAVLRLALAHPGVAFHLRHDGKEVLTLPKAERLFERLRAALGAALGEEPLELATRDAELGLEGVLQRPSEAKREARQYLFLNGRHIRDRALQRAIKDAYASFLFGNVQASYVLHLSLDPALADPNVHPTKIEVRFRDAGRIFGLLRRSVEQRLRASGHAAPGARLLLGDGEPLPEMPMPIGVRDEGPPSRAGSPSSGASFPIVARPELPFDVHAAEATSATAPTSGAREAIAPDREPARSAGAEVIQLHQRYLVRATYRGLEVIDQHALHERVNYEAFRSDLRAKGIAIQRLLAPEIAPVDPALLASIEERGEELQRLGLDLRPFGRDSVALFGLPARLSGEDPGHLLERALRLLREAADGEELAPEHFLAEVLASRACRGSVMVGDPMRPEQVRYLLERAATLADDSTCPHGRPTRIAFSVEELDRAFKRR